jgi:hypothetical protein
MPDWAAQEEEPVRCQRKQPLRPGRAAGTFKFGDRAGVN